MINYSGGGVEYVPRTCIRKRYPPDNNGVERVNRRFVAVRNDSGGNRTQKGMDANSILLSIFATDWINGNSFFDHLVKSLASGDG